MPNKKTAGPWEGRAGISTKPHPHYPPTQRRKLPPYARALRDRLRAGWWPSNGGLFVATGAEAWDWARAWREDLARAYVLLPPDEDPSGYDWAIAAGFEVLIYDFGDLDERVAEQLAVLALHAGARLALVILDSMGLRPRLLSYRTPTIGEAAA